MEQSVDGDLYLINTISRYSVLWDRKNFDSDQRNEVWLKLSKKLNIKLEWMKKRWSYLREQYVRHLKQINNSESDQPSKKSYKYFTEMSFLANHIQIRNSNYQDIVSHNRNGEKSEEDDVEADDKDNGDESECIDFVITETEIEAYNDDDDDNMFVELPEEEDEPAVFRPSTELVTQTPVTYIKPVSNVLAKPTRTAGVVIEDSIEVIEDSIEVIEDSIEVIEDSIEVIEDSIEVKASQQHVSMDRTENESAQKPTKTTTESRCEDVIFGELVTSMLKKMDSPSRKRAKKEILNILLS